MKRVLFILFVLIGCCQLSIVNSQLNGKLSNSKYLDDAYYWPVVDTIVPTEPVYDKSAREFIFLEDTTQYPDTVVMRIVEK